MVIATLRRREARPLATALALALLYFCVLAATIALPLYRFRLVTEPLMIASALPLLEMLMGQFGWFRGYLGRFPGSLTATSS